MTAARQQLVWLVGLGHIRQLGHLGHVHCTTALLERLIMIAILRRHAFLVVRARLRHREHGAHVPIFFVRQGHQTPTIIHLLLALGAVLERIPRWDRQVLVRFSIAVLGRRTMTITHRPRVMRVAPGHTHQ